VVLHVDLEELDGARGDLREIGQEHAGDLDHGRVC
jgi:hypothetical protein